MSDKPTKTEVAVAEASTDEQTYVLPELGITVQARSAEEAGEKANNLTKKQAKESK